MAAAFSREVLCRLPGKPLSLTLTQRKQGRDPERRPGYGVLCPCRSPQAQAPRGAGTTGPCGMRPGPAQVRSGWRKGPQVWAGGPHKAAVPWGPRLLHLLERLPSLWAGAGGPRRRQAPHLWAVRLCQPRARLPVSLSAPTGRRGRGLPLSRTQEGEPARFPPLMVSNVGCRPSGSSGHFPALSGPPRSPVAAATRWGRWAFISRARLCPLGWTGPARTWAPVLLVESGRGPSPRWWTWEPCRCSPEPLVFWGFSLAVAVSALVRGRLAFLSLSGRVPRGKGLRDDTGCL